MGNEAGPNIETRIVKTTVQGTIDQCFQVGLDVESYPEWIDSLDSVVVESTDEAGRPSQVRFEASGIGRRSSYVLAYQLEQAPNRLGWTLVTGDLMRAIEGSCKFSDVTESSDTPLTEVEYHLAVDLAIPLPGFVKRRAEDKVLEAALSRFKNRVETVSQAEGRV